MFPYRNNDPQRRYPHLNLNPTVRPQHPPPFNRPPLPYDQPSYQQQQPAQQQTFYQPGPPVGQFRPQTPYLLQPPNVQDDNFQPQQEATQTFQRTQGHLVYQQVPPPGPPLQPHPSSFQPPPANFPHLDPNIQAAQQPLYALLAQMTNQITELTKKQEKTKEKAQPPSFLRTQIPENQTIFMTTKSKKVIRKAKNYKLSEHEKQCEKALVQALQDCQEANSHFSSPDSWEAINDLFAKTQQKLSNCPLSKNQLHPVLASKTAYQLKLQALSQILKNFSTEFNTARETKLKNWVPLIDKLLPALNIRARNLHGFLEKLNFPNYDKPATFTFLQKSLIGIISFMEENSTLQGRHLFKQLCRTPAFQIRYRPKPEWEKLERQLTQNLTKFLYDNINCLGKNPSEPRVPRRDPKEPPFASIFVAHNKKVTDLIEKVANNICDPLFSRLHVIPRGEQTSDEDTYVSEFLFSNTHRAMAACLSLNSLHTRVSLISTPFTSCVDRINTLNSDWYATCIPKFPFIPSDIQLARNLDNRTPLSDLITLHGLQIGNQGQMEKVDIASLSNLAAIYDANSDPQIRGLNINRNRFLILPDSCKPASNFFTAHNVYRLTLQDQLSPDDLYYLYVLSRKTRATLWPPHVRDHTEKNREHSIIEYIRNPLVHMENPFVWLGGRYNQNFSLYVPVPLSSHNFPLLTNTKYPIFTIRVFRAQLLHSIIAQAGENRGHGYTLVSLSAKDVNFGFSNGESAISITYPCQDQFLRLSAKITNPFCLFPTNKIESELRSAFSSENHNTSMFSQVSEHPDLLMDRFPNDLLFLALFHLELLGQPFSHPDTKKFLSLVDNHPAHAFDTVRLNHPETSSSERYSILYDILATLSLNPILHSERPFETYTEKITNDIKEADYRVVYTFLSLQAIFSKVQDSHNFDFLDLPYEYLPASKRPHEDFNPRSKPDQRRRLARVIIIQISDSYLSEVTPMGRKSFLSKSLQVLIEPLTLVLEPHEVSTANLEPFVSRRAPPTVRLKKGKPSTFTTSQDRNSQPRRRTAPCRNFQRNGYCKFGDKCHFLHTESKDQPTSSRPNLNNRSQNSRTETKNSNVSFSESRSSHRSTSRSNATSTSSNSSSYKSRYVRAVNKSVKRNAPDSSNSSSSQKSQRIELRINSESKNDSNKSNDDTEDDDDDDGNIAPSDGRPRNEEPSDDDDLDPLVPGINI